MSSREVADRYLAAGLSVVPIRLDGTKGPMGPWKHLQSRRMDFGAVQFNFADAGVGIICGAVSGNLEVLDFDDPNVPGEFFAMIPEELYDKLVTVRTPSGGVHAYYRCSTLAGNQKLAMRPDPDDYTRAQVRIETRGEGGYVVAPGSPPESHASGNCYEVVSGNLEDIQTLTPEEREVLFETARSFDRSGELQKPDPVQIPKRPAVRPVDRIEATGLSSGDDFNQRAAWSELLLPAGWSISHESSDGVFWRRPGKDTPGHSAVERNTQHGNRCLVVFSSAAHPFEAEKSYTKFRAYSILSHGGDDRSAAAELYGLGYGSPGEEDTAYLDNLIATLTVNDPDPPVNLPVHAEPSGFPESIYDEAPGLIKEVFDHTMASALYASKPLAFAGALALVSAITGRKVRDAFDTRTNLYILGLARASSGKNPPRLTNKEILHQAGYGNLIGPESAASHAALISLLHANPCQLMQNDEIGRWLKTTKDAGTPHLFGIRSILMKFFSDSGTIWKGDAYADTKKNKVINQPHFVLFGTTVPQSFYESLDPESLTDGFVPRMLVFMEPEVPLLNDNRSRSVADVPASILETVRAWKDQEPEDHVAMENPRPRLVQHEPEAYKLAWNYMYIVKLKNRDEADAAASVWGRAPEKMNKVALLYACAKSPQEPLITVDAVTWAKKLTNYLTRKMLWDAGLHVAENPHEGKYLKILRVIRANQGIKTTALGKKLRSFQRKQRNDLLAQMIEDGELVTIPTSSGGRPSNAWWTPDAAPHKERKTSADEVEDEIQNIKKMMENPPPIGNGDFPKIH